MQQINKENLQRWRLLIEEQKQGGLTITEFCKQRSTGPSRYHYYQTLIYNPEKLKSFIL
ncbi:MAG: hypothetical protein H0W64_09980 [Gammaproteobacteria bacterium]|nr:hypothetical protein [Gammaproteobacteria bacterium]